MIYLQLIYFLLIQIIIITSGETEENVRAIIQGQNDTKLNTTGLLQARLLAARFSIKKFDLIYSSDLSRAYDTCKELILGSPVDSLNVPVQTDHTKLTCSLDSIKTDTRLRERFFGSIQGQSLSYLQKLAKEAGKTVVDYTPNGGESLEDVRNRVLDFFNNRLIIEVEAMKSFKLSSSSACSNQQPINVLLVSHGGVIRELITLFHSFGHHSFRARSDRVRFVPPNTSVNEFLVHYYTNDNSNNTNSNQNNKNNSEQAIEKAKFQIQTVELIKLHDINHLDETLQEQARNQKQVNNSECPSI